MFNFNDILNLMVLLAMAWTLVRLWGCHGNPKNLTTNREGGNSELEAELPPQLRAQAEKYIRRWMDSSLFRPKS